VHRPRTHRISHERDRARAADVDVDGWLVLQGIASGPLRFVAWLLGGEGVALLLILPDFLASLF